MTAITGDWQARLVERDFLIGRGTVYPGLGGITGTGVLKPRYDDQARGMGNGDAFGVDTLPARILHMPIEVLGDSDSEVWAAYRALAVAWRHSRLTELALDVRIPGSAETVLRFFGRPLELPGDPHGLKGHLATFAEFRADPYAYGALVESAVDSASPLTLDDSTMGDDGCDTDRCVITINGNGGTPVITNTTTGGSITFTAVLAGAQSYEIDLHAQTVTKAGIDRITDVDAGSLWFMLAGGVDNVLTFTGCASIQADYRPAYEVL